jgi:glutamate dehydrogenase
MLLEAQKGNAEIIGKAVALLRGKVPEGKIALAETFTRQYYSRVEADDLAERNLSDLCGAALAHLDFMGKFKSGAPKLRVYNPQIQKDGWESPHTIIEIVNDDMPFLVDSVTMEINRQRLKAHLTIHPVIKTKHDAEGELNEILPPEVVQSGHSESVMHVSS